MEESIIERQKVIVAYVNTYTNDELFSYHFNEVINLAEACYFEVVDTLIKSSIIISSSLNKK